MQTGEAHGPYKIVYSKVSHKQIPNLKSAGLDKKVQNLIDIIRENPWEDPPPFEELRGDLKGFLSRRINIHHRLVYEVFEEQKTVRVLSMWTHYATMHGQEP